MTTTSLEAAMATPITDDDLRARGAAPSTGAIALPDIDGIRVPLDDIDDNPYQPRIDYDRDRITALAESIQAHGLLQVPLARRVGGGYELAFGHSRLRAYRVLQAIDRDRWGTMPLNIRTLDNETMALHAWTENRDRKDLTAYEEAMAIQRYTADFGWTQARAAEQLRLDRSTISNKLRLLKLPIDVLTNLRTGVLSERQAIALLPLADLPLALLRRTTEEWRTYRIYIGGRSAVDILQEAPTLDSTTIRQQVNHFLNSATIDLQKRPWASSDIDDIRVQASNCKNCPIRMKSANRCPDHVCAGHKTNAWAHQQAAPAAAALHVPTVGAASDIYGWCDDLQGVQRAAIKTLAAERKCGNLGVVYDPAKSWYPQKIDKHPHCFLVCAHGVGKRCACKAALARDTTQPEGSEAARARVARQRIKRDLIPLAEAALQGVLPVMNPVVGRALLDRIDGRSAQKLPADANATAITTALATVLVARSVSGVLEYNPDVERAQNLLQRLLQEFGAPIPAGVCAQTEVPDVPPA